ncbi:MAG: aldose 1-epimerase family protein [Lachnospiraceae bacterium]|nr:aldose 1-epimerase family protein [Lachnospiraceae bacterium]
MKHTIQSDNLTVTIDSFGAGITSIIQDETEYLWQGEPAYWFGQAPIMFPICGCLRDGNATLLNGKTVTLARHGFARRRPFTLKSKTDTEVTLELVSDDETLEAYPFPFSLQMNYKVEDNRLILNHIVTNTGDETMPFFIGGHPGFNCPMHKGEKFEDYVVEMEAPEYANCPTISDSGLLLDEKRTLRFDNRSILPLTHDLFYQDAICLEYPRSTYAILRHKDSQHGVRIDFKGFDFFQIWSSANDGPFIALEPWSGTATMSSEDDIFEHKRGVKLLEPGKTEVITYSISII